jgi:large subunit ribosomal protein L28
MSKLCELTGKRPQTGHNVSHANNKTKRRFLPNLRSVRIQLEDGTSTKIRICAKELRTLKKNS